MKTTLNLPENLLKEALHLSGVNTKTEAVIIALKEFIRQQRIERIIEQTGDLQFSNEWEDSRHDR